MVIAWQIMLVLRMTRQVRAVNYRVPARSVVSRCGSQSYLRLGYAWTSAVERDRWFARITFHEIGRDLV